MCLYALTAVRDYLNSGDHWVDPELHRRSYVLLLMVLNEAIELKFYENHIVTLFERTSRQLFVPLNSMQFKETILFKMAARDLS